MKLSHQQGLIEVEKEVTEKSKVDQCHQKLFLVPCNKGNNPVTNHFGGAFNTGASKIKRMKVVGRFLQTSEKVPKKLFCPRVIYPSTSKQYNKVFCNFIHYSFWTGALNDSMAGFVYLSDPPAIKLVLRELNTGRPLCLLNP